MRTSAPPAPLRNAALALLSTALAWILVYLAVMLPLRALLGWRCSASSAAAFLATTGLFSAASLLLIFVPLVTLVLRQSRLFRLATFPWVGAAAGLVTFLCFSAWSTWPDISSLPPFLRAFLPFAGYATAAGLVAAFSYSVLLRREAKTRGVR